MRPNKIFSFIASAFLFAALSQTTVFAVDAETATADNLDNLPAATFVADNSSSNEAEVAELKKTLADLQIQLSSMRNGMQDLQTKWVESEMKNLQAQLAALRGSTATAIPTTFSAPEATITVPAPDETIVKVTSLEDFVGFPIEQSDDKATSATSEATTQDGAEVNSILKTADAEIAKLEAILSAKKALNEDESAHAEITKKITELKTARSKLAEISIKDTVEKLAEAEPDAEVTPVTSSNIIAQADGAVLFQFPRAISRTADTTTKSTGLDASNLTADLLAANSPPPRNSAPRAKWSIFSETSLVIFATALLIGIVIFVTWLLRNERRLLAATSRRFQQLDQRPNFDLGIHTKKSVQIKNNPRGKNIIQ